MPAKRPRSGRENVTPIKSVRVEAAHESRPQNGAQDGFAPADNTGQPELEHAAATDALNSSQVPIRCSASTAKVVSRRQRLLRL
jgi:hypothetical protein